MLLSFVFYCRTDGRIDRNFKQGGVLTATQHTVLYVNSRQDSPDTKYTSYKAIS